MKHRRLALLCLVVVSLACSIQVPSGTISTATSLAVVTEDLVEAEKPTMPLGKPSETATVTAYQSLHVRAARGTDAIVIGYLYHGDTVTLTGQCDQGWAEIVWKDGTAWVNADFLSKNKCSEEQ